MRVLAIGECMAELAPAPSDGDYRLGFAGDTFNTAWYLARMGDVPTAYFTALGTDALSTRMRAFMADSGIDVSAIRTIEGGTVGLYLISLQNGERSFSYWRGQSAARALADDATALADAMSGADLIYLSGITLAILDPAARERLLVALANARADGRKVAFDPNLRPRLWPDTATMTDAIMAAAGVCDIALPSFEDEASFFGDVDIDATADRYAAAGATTVVVKNGDGAVRYMIGGHRGTVPVEPVTSVVDTTAAGDSFNAGILASIAQDRPLTDGIAQACRLAAQVVQGRGALVPVDIARS
ncbi:sugar kinase [Jannaschia donghaensis]|uniref:2-dehydro-3-deoxygluconokinase n=1 Tax=Jannaschia donghaensis TaxID=420998 RepID=A0A0M6YI98_9RHOB|nr:sugar kinase [Jannaschia donghaensis]CTQ49243.1 2-dehydro-3-deoxygluconokinase [Jannaschia donghaensis]